MLDILTWTTYRIDYCFNIKTPYVSDYLDVMNEGFRMSNTGTRVNYPEEKGCPAAPTSRRRATTR